MNLREAAQQALEALDWLQHHLTQHHGCLHMDPTSSGIPAWLKKTEAALKAALTEPVQEPVAWYHVPYPGIGISPMVSLSQQREPSLYGAVVPLYLAPPIMEPEIKVDKAEPVQEPVAWTGYDLDGMVEAFSRVIEAHHSNKHPCHNPIDMDAKLALRILRGFIPAMKAYTAPPQRKPLTEEEIEEINRDLPLLHMQASKGSVAVVFARAVERAHGICE